MLLQVNLRIGLSFLSELGIVHDRDQNFPSNSIDHDQDRNCRSNSFDHDGNIDRVTVKTDQDDRSIDR
jgi:hypothetical protein